tara:strand:+ start:143 stop:850 length:708 start_codon:yes stop_codon:yes gene_type:complete
MANNQFTAITFTSSGYIDISYNLIMSIKRNNVPINLKLYCLDIESFKFFEEKNEETFLLEDESSFSYKLMKQNDSDFGELMLKKFFIIHKNLLEDTNVLYVDGDIVLKKDFTKYFESLLLKNDIVFQNDKRPSKPNQINVCAGFMLIKSNKKMIKFFDPEKIPIKKIVNYKTHDQTHLNKSLAKFKYTILPLQHFPNGPYFYENYNKIDPFMVHFNYILGEDKISRMKELNEWYL